MSVLVTGGCGFIGSHTCIELLNAGKDVVVIDNLNNSKIEVLNRIKKITGKEVKFYKVDLLDRAAVDKVFSENNISVVIHFAGHKNVGESCHIPIEYYHNNLTGAFILLDVMRNHNCKKMVFSSSSTVYFKNPHPPCKETDELGTTNPYGRTKLFQEQIYTDVWKSDNEWSFVFLRYFNPVAAHESGDIGEDPNGIPGNLMPYIMHVAVGRQDHLKVFGNDYDTPDGTGVRDYIHVVDVAKGHLCAIEYALQHTGTEAVNLGTGRGYSVLEVVKAFEKACGKPIKYEIVERRAGDIAAVYCDPSKAKKLFGWVAQYDLDKMCEDAWRFIQKNPQGL